MSKPCKEYQGYVMPNGYGTLTVDSKTKLAHRHFAELAHGPCPEGQVVRHTCDNRRCIEEEHLVYGTQGDNLNDRKERHRYRKLTREDAEAIKIDTRRGSEIARCYGVSHTMVIHIKKGRQWV